MGFSRYYGVLFVWFLFLNSSQAGIYSGGSGTEGSPYLISSADDWVEFVNTSGDWSKQFILTSHVDLADVPDLIPVGIDTDSEMPGYQGTGFSGTFNGLGYSIYNATINMPDTDRVGIFGYLNYSGKIINLKVRSVNITGKEDVGGLVGYNRGDISKCLVTGNVNGIDSVGGIAGLHYGEGISQSRSSVIVSGASKVGGLVGYCYMSRIRDCYSTDNISCSNGPAGGLVGLTRYSHIYNCYSTGEVTCNSKYTGGLVGESQSEIYGCVWDVETSGQTGSAGGRGLTTAQMKTLSIFQNIGWEGTKWRKFSSDYPHLAWENYGTPIPVPANVPLSGDGTTDNPYKVSSADDFAILSWYVSALDRHFLLTENLDLTGIKLYPIGEINLFTGCFDGGGNTITGASIDMPDRDNVGIFGRIGSNVEIKGLSVQNAYIAGDEKVGILTGLNSGNIVECNASGVVIGNRYSGGLVGLNDYQASISDCYTDVSITGDSSIGGISGNNYGDIIRCYAVGQVTAQENIGGLLGYNRGEIRECFSNCLVEAEENAGGLIGNNGGNIYDCYASGQVYGTTNLGGLTGCNSGSIHNCYSNTYVAGVSGSGGLIGGYNTGTVFASFWDVETSSQTGSGGGRGINTSEMNSISIFQNAGWGGGRWVMLDVFDYPRLWWEQTDYSVIGPASQIPLEGSGSQEDPYKIWTSQELALLGWYSSLGGKYFKLMEDLDLNGIKIYPIDDFSSPVSRFDGNNHVLSNVTIDLPQSTFVGLFRKIQGSNYMPNTIINLGIENIQVTGGDYVGGLVAENYGLIENCYITGLVTGDNNVGGMTAFNGGTITNSNANVSVTGSGDFIGGLVGQMPYTNMHGNVNNCFAEGDVIGFNYVGGLVGQIIGYQSGESFQYCYSTGTVTGNQCVGGLAGIIVTGERAISRCYSTSPVNGVDNVGGLIGKNETSLSYCGASGPVTGTGNNVGGLTGSNVRDIKDCYASGSVIGSDNVGGLSGSHEYGLIQDCYSISHVEGTGENTGSLIGSCNREPVGCYWNTETSGISEGIGNIDPDPAGVIASSSYDMHNYDTFIAASWDFSHYYDGDVAAWYMPDNDYPRLAWRNGIGSTKYSGGKGTEDSPYIIAVASDWLELTFRSADWSCYFEMTDNIDLSDAVDLMPVAPYEYTEYGNYFVGPFTGVLDGNGYIIYNAVINMPQKNSIGLFREIQDAKILNLGLVNIEISGDSHVGGLVGSSINSEIENCFAIGSVNCVGSTAGGLIGRTIDGSVNNCYSEGSVTGRYDLGGLIGENGSLVSNSYFNGSIEGMRDIGGLIAQSYGQVNNCYAAGNILVSEFRGGGLICSCNADVDSCYAAFTFIGETESIGGLFGYYTNDSIISCYWDTELSGVTKVFGNAPADITLDGALGLISSDMYNKNTFVDSGWDFDNKWRVNGSYDYPKLTWQPFGDLNNDSSVDMADFVTLSNAWQTKAIEPGWNHNYDLHTDGVIDIQDLLTIAKNWLTGTTP